MLIYANLVCTSSLSDVHTHTIMNNVRVNKLLLYELIAVGCDHVVYA